MLPPNAKSKKRAAGEDSDEDMEELTGEMKLQEEGAAGSLGGSLMSARAALLELLACESGISSTIEA